jgi:hypothetical protein
MKYLSEPNMHGRGETALIRADRKSKVETEEMKDMNERMNVSGVGT